jgi:hypothetical protein
MDPIGLVGSARAAALQRHSRVALYSIESLSSDAKDCGWGWRFDYFGKVSKDEDRSEKLRVRVEYLPEKRGATCFWHQSVESDHGLAPTWGTLPLEAALAQRRLSVADATAVAKRQFHHPLRVTAVLLTSPNVKGGPAFTYLIFGTLCEQSVFYNISASDGKVVDRTEHPLCYEN